MSKESEYIDKMMAEGQPEAQSNPLADWFQRRTKARRESEQAANTDLSRRYGYVNEYGDMVPGTETPDPISEALKRAGGQVAQVGAKKPSIYDQLLNLFGRKT